MTTLAALLAGQKRDLDALDELLDTERDLLSRGAVDGQRLEDIAHNKRAHLEALQESESRRRALTGHLDESEETAARAGCSTLWLTVKSTARRVAEANRRNGELINLRMMHNQRMLNVLRDAAGTSVYGPNGQSPDRGGQLASRA